MISEPSPLLSTVGLGMVLLSPADMVTAFANFWPNDKAADRTLKQGVPTLPGFVPMTYQLKGPRMKWRRALFDPIVIPDPRAWLEGKLGPIRGMRPEETL